MWIYIKIYMGIGWDQMVCWALEKWYNSTFKNQLLVGVDDLNASVGRLGSFIQPYWQGRGYIYSRTGQKYVGENSTFSPEYVQNSRNSAIFCTFGHKFGTCAKNMGLYRIIWTTYFSPLWAVWDWYWYCPLKWIIWIWKNTTLCILALEIVPKH